MSHLSAYNELSEVYDLYQEFTENVDNAAEKHRLKKELGFHIGRRSSLHQSRISQALDTIMRGTFKAREVVEYFELSEEWQAEAVSNLDEQAEEVSYLAPEDDDEPARHILWDLSECMVTTDSDYDGVIGISNNSAMAVVLSDCSESAFTWILS